MPAIALAGTLIARDNEGAIQFGKGLVSTIVLSHGLKRVIDKERPDGRDDQAFPSSHTAVAMHTAAYGHERYGLKLGLPAYVAAAYVGHSRVHDGRHDETDVVAGAVIGFVAARFFTDRYKSEENQLTIVPAVGENLIGLSISFRH